MEVTIRKGGAELFDRLEPLWLALHAHHQKGQPQYAFVPDEVSWQARRAQYEEWIKDEGSFVLLAERGDRLVGYAFVRVNQGPEDTWATGSRYAELQTLSVDPAERGAGIGTLLLDAMDAELDALGSGGLYIAVLTGNDGAQRFYERRGMRPLMIYYGRVPAAANHPEP